MAIHPEVLETTFGFCLPALGNEVVATEAATCFSRVCAKSAAVIAASPSVLVELIEATTAEAIIAQGAEVRQKIMDGLSRPTAQIPGFDEKSAAITALLAHVASRLAMLAGHLDTSGGAALVQDEGYVASVAEELQVLGCCVKFVSVRDSSHFAYKDTLHSTTLRWKAV